MSRAYRTRALLHRLDRTEFCAWLETEGWEQHAPKGEWESIRASKDGKWLIIFDRNRGDHLTVRGEDYPIVRRFYDSRKGYEPLFSQLAEMGRRP